MFKKITFITLFALSVLTLSAAETKLVKKYWDFTDADKAALNAYTKDRTFNECKCAMLLEEFAKTNPKAYTDYEVYNKFLDDQLKAGLAFSKSTLTICLRTKLSEDIKSQMFRANKNKYPFAINWPIWIPDTVLKEFDNKPIKVAEHMVNYVPSYRPTAISEILKFIDKYCDKESSADVIRVLKAIKRKYYTNISVSDEWKAQMIAVELKIKANE